MTLLITVVVHELTSLSEPDCLVCSPGQHFVWGSPPPQAGRRHLSSPPGLLCSGLCGHAMKSVLHLDAPGPKRNISSAVSGLFCLHGPALCTTRCLRQCLAFGLAAPPTTARNVKALFTWNHGLVDGTVELSSLQWLPTCAMPGTICLHPGASRAVAMPHSMPNANAQPAGLGVCNAAYDKVLRATAVAHAQHNYM